MRKIVLLATILVAVILVAAVFKFRPLAQAGTAYAAKALCSGVFVSNLDAERVAREEFVDLSTAFKYLKSDVDMEGYRVSTNLLGLAKARASYHPERGCTLIHDDPGNGAQKPSKSRGTFASLPPSNSGAGFDQAALDAALDFAFETPAGSAPLRTRAVVIIKNGALIGERYADGIYPATKLKGWSMNKTITGLVIGTMVDDGLLDPEAPAPVSAWSGEDDPRRDITLNHLMQMASGLDFDETYTDMTSDAIKMLFLSPSASAYAEQSELAHTPGTHWEYSSGTSNILAAIAGDIAEAQGTNITEYMWDRLLTPAGVTTAVMETDQGGDFVGSSYGYMAAQDWGRLGLLMLRGGVGPDGQRIISEEQINFMVTPNGLSNGIYGGQTWLNAGTDKGADWTYGGVPKDAYYFSGHDGQFVVVIPSRDMVIVRLGESSWVNTNKHLGELLRRVLAADNSQE